MTMDGLLLGLVSPPRVPPPWSVVRANTPLPPRCTHGPTARRAEEEALRAAEDDDLRAAPA